MSATAFQRLRREQAKMETSLENENKLAEPTNKELMALLDALGVKYDKKPNKATLLELLKKAQGDAVNKAPDEGGTSMDNPENQFPGETPNHDKDEYSGENPDQHKETLLKLLEGAE
jgi:hypothetical protein